QRQQPVVRRNAVGCRNAIVLRVGVLTVIDRRRHRAAGLREHLESFAVERRSGCREHDRLIENDDVVEADRRFSTIDHAEPTKWSVAFALDLDGRRPAEAPRSILRREMVLASAILYAGAHDRIARLPPG